MAKSRGASRHQPIMGGVREVVTVLLIIVVSRDTNGWLAPEPDQPSPGFSGAVGEILSFINGVELNETYINPAEPAVAQPFDVVLPVGKLW